MGEKCAWCGNPETAQVLDGEALCHPCCNRWARGEGLSTLEREQDATLPLDPVAVIAPLL
jgi:hypothetical protein